MEPKHNNQEEELYELRNTISMLKEIIKVQNSTICRLIDAYIIESKNE